MKLRRAFTFLVGFCVSLSALDAYAARVFFSLVGPPVLSDPGDPESAYVAPAPVTIGDRPVLTLNPGQTGSLHVWIKPDNSPPAQNWLSAAFDIESSNISVGTATGFSVLNPVNRELAPQTRWNGTGVDVVGIQPADPLYKANWISNAAGARVTFAGIGNSNSGFVNDAGRDNVSRSFYFGRVNFQIPLTHPVGGLQETGLYFRVGRTKAILTGTGSPPVPLQFGAEAAPTYPGNLPQTGDPILPGLALADAIINVDFGGVIEPELSVIISGGTGAATPTDSVRFVSPGALEFRSAGGITSGRINIGDMPAQASGDLTVYFDLVDGEDAAALVAALNALPNRQFMAMTSSQSGPLVGVGIATADIKLVFAGLAQVDDSDHLIDFDFGDVGVAAVGVPEPSTFGLAGLAGALGFVGFLRRRRSA